MLDAGKIGSMLSSWDQEMKEIANQIKQGNWVLGARMERDGRTLRLH